MARMRRAIPLAPPRELGRLGEIAFSLAIETASDLAAFGKVPDLKVARTRMLLAIGACEAIEAWIRAERRRAKKAAA